MSPLKKWRQSYLDRYTVKIPQTIFDQIKSIKNYIQDVLLSPAAALKTSQLLLEGIKSLQTFPERGFNADEKVGRQISKHHKTFGIVIANRKYLLFYNINTEDKIVNITHLLPVKSDYAKLFL